MNPSQLSRWDRSVVAPCRRLCPPLPLGAWLAALLVTTSGALADTGATGDGSAVQPEDAPFYDEIIIVGKRDDLDGLVGAAHVIGQDVLQRFGYADIQRIVRQAPGVSVQVEDGYGLRPNISIRGVASERSGRITLLEDNVLIAPAPYSAPSAYYFPTAGRMYAFEILKGPSAIAQGPYTIGGALNMISTPIPATGSGSSRLLRGRMRRGARTRRSAARPRPGSGSWSRPTNGSPTAFRTSMGAVATRAWRCATTC